MSKLVKEFKDFALKGSFVDMAVGIIVGATVGKVVSSLVNDIIMPPITLLTGSSNFSDLKIVLREAVMQGEEVVRPAVEMNIGSFIQALIDFIIILFVIFMMIKGINKLRRKKAEEPAPAVPSEEVTLLREIRDSLKK